MTDNTILQADFDLLVERCKSKQGELITARSELNNLVGTLVDAVDKERKALLQRRVDLLNLVGALDDELQVLTHRRDVANLVIYESRVQEAQAIADDLDRQRRVKGKELNALINEQLHFINGGRGRLPKDTGDKELIRLESRMGQLKAEVSILTRDGNRAGVFLERARGELEAVKKELEHGIRL